jgi:hypothetical protein
MTKGRLTPALTCNFSGADDGIRTRDPHLGKVVLYQLSHVRTPESGTQSLGTGTQAFNGRLSSAVQAPVDPNPPSPRLDGGSSSTHDGRICGRATTTSCAIRSPLLIFTA